MCVREIGEADRVTIGVRDTIQNNDHKIRGEYNTEELSTLRDVHK